MKSILMIAAVVVLGALSPIIKPTGVNSAMPSDKNAKSTVSFVVDGDGYADQMVSITEKNDICESAAAYLLKSKVIAIKMGDAKPRGDFDNSVQIYIEGSGVGKRSYHAGPKAAHFNLIVRLSRADTVSVYEAKSSNAFADINITKYNACGKDIEGEFNCTLVNAANGELVTIKHGHFKVPHVVDYEL